MNTAAGVVNGPSTPTRRRPAPSEDHRRDLETVIPSPRSSLYQRVDPADCGELALALRAGMPAARIVVHGNASGEAELSAAVAAGVGRVVLDSLDVADRLAAVAARRRRRGDVLLRIASGIDAAGHAAVSTGGDDQTFGVPLAQGWRWSRRGRCTWSACTVTSVRRSPTSPSRSTACRREGGGERSPVRRGRRRHERRPPRRAVQRLVRRPPRRPDDERGVAGGHRRRAALRGRGRAGGRRPAPVRRGGRPTCSPCPGRAPTTTPWRPR